MRNLQSTQRRGGEQNCVAVFKKGQDEKKVHSPEGGQGVDSRQMEEKRINVTVLCCLQNFSEQGGRPAEKELNGRGKVKGTLWLGFSNGNNRK